MAGLQAVFRWNASHSSGMQPHERAFNADVRGMKGYRSDHHTSLPPLPQVPYQPQDHCRPWGEDAVLERNGFKSSSGYGRFKHNFDNCHPVKQPVAAKYDNGMFPKALYTDLSQLHQSAGSTLRHVPQPKNCEVFHTIDPNRTNQDAKFPLNEATRRALGNYVNKLYTSSRYEDMYQDTGEFLVEKLRRDAQYYEQCVKHKNELPTCCRILNHPDPCHWCWNGGFNKDFEEKLAQFQSKLKDNTQCDPTLCTGSSNVPCKTCKSVSCRNKDVCLRPLTDCNVLADAGDSANIGDADISKNEWHPQQPEGFGPWRRDERLGDYEDNIFQKSVCESRFPSALHCRQPLYDQAPVLPESINQTYYCGLPKETLFPWTFGQNQMIVMSEPRRIMTEIPKTPFLVDRIEPEVTPYCLRNRIEAEVPPYSLRNTWTFRDENNLRIPCISSVIGNKQKTEAHKRFHAEHNEPIPDLRDFYRYSRRVKFHGYHTSVTR